MKKKMSIILIIIGVLLIIVPLAYYFLHDEKEKTNVPEENNDTGIVDEAEKEELSAKIKALTSDYYCNSSRQKEDTSTCVYFNDKIESKDISNNYKLYYLILSNIDKSTEVTFGEENSLLSEDDYFIGEAEHILTNYISGDTIKAEYEKVYGTNDNFDFTLVDEIEANPKILYNKDKNIYMISKDNEELRNNYVLSKVMTYERKDDKILAHVRVVYITKPVNEENVYYVFAKINDSNTVENIQKEDIATYDLSKLEKGEYSEYTFVFEKENNEYVFKSAEKVND